jgi:adenylate cyclase
MLWISVTEETATTRLEHPAGPIEFGRGPAREARRFTFKDPYASWNHLRVEELADGRIRVENLSRTKVVWLANGASIAVGSNQELEAPLTLITGHTTIEVARAGEEPIDESSLHTIAPPVRRADTHTILQTQDGLDNSPVSELLTRWFEIVLALQRSAVDSRDFYNRGATALVELIGLDMGLILLRKEDTWNIAASSTRDSSVPVTFSRTILNHVVSERRTFYQDVRDLDLRASLRDIRAAVVSPVFGLEEDIIGAVYGIMNSKSMLRACRIGLLAAQMVQLLASALGATLARVEATRNRILLEQSFSPELVRALEKDPNLLEGTNRVVTVLVSDLRGFTSLSERLGPEITCRVIRDVIERLSEKIVQQNGAIVDYAGDGILAMWNAPVEQSDHAARACRAALALLAEMPALTEKWQATIGVPLCLGVGVNTGTAQVGNTGSSRKIKYGPHGYTVNLASRVQNATKELKTPLLITEETRKLLPESFITTRAAPVCLAGVSHEVVLHELHNELASFI